MCTHVCTKSDNVYCQLKAVSCFVSHRINIYEVGWQLFWESQCSVLAVFISLLSYLDWTQASLLGFISTSLLPIIMTQCAIHEQCESYLIKSLSFNRMWTRNSVYFFPASLYHYCLTEQQHPASSVLNLCWSTKNLALLQTIEKNYLRTSEIWWKCHI